MKLQGPMMSFGASGSIGGLVTMATWKGRPYARQLVIPSNPRSAQQTAFRAMFRFLSQAWGILDPGDQATWQALATAGNYSTFNAFMKLNQDRWGRFLPPTINPDPSGAAAVDIVTLSATAGVRSVSLDITVPAGSDKWGAVVYMAAGAAPTGTLTETIDVVLADSTGNVIVPVLGLTTGTTYHFKVQAFSTGGEFGALSPDASATPT